MAIAKVRKVLIASHKSEEKIFLSQLQDLGILHIIKKEETQESTLKSTVKETLDEISSSIEYLNSFTEKQGFLSGLVPSKAAIEQTEYLALAQKYNLSETIDKINKIRQKLTSVLNQQKLIESDIKSLTPWENLKYDLTEVYKSQKIEMIFGQFLTRETHTQTQNAIKELPAQIEIINQDKEISYCIIAYPKEIRDTVKPHLQKLEIIDLSRFHGIPKDLINKLSQQQKELEKETTAAKNEANKLVSEVTKLKILYDYYYNLASQEEIKPELEHTNEVVFIEGWVKQKDFKKLEKVVNSFKTVVVTPLIQREDEEPPVALQNRSIFRPFEIIVEMYTMPTPVELDPTPLLAPFFAVFFALCLTDAGYGIILLVLTLLLLKKMKTAGKFLKLLAICGGVTILAGAITGGWFGDIVDKLGLQFLVKFRDMFLLFDPIKNPMPFFILSIAIGYLHLNYGFLIEIYDSFRQKNAQAGLFETLPWFLFLNGLIVYVFTGRFFPLSIKPYLILIILVAIATIIAFTRRNQKLMLNQTGLGIIFLGGLILIAAKMKLCILPTFYLSWNLGKFLLFFGFFGLSVMSLISQISLKKFKIVSIIVLLGLLTTFIGYLLFNLSVYLFILFSLVFIMLSVNNRRLIKNVMWGLYTLYGGTSFLGVVLSYIRLMALGMVTAGIAMAINTIAWMVIKIPIVGIILALIILIFGHAYNIAINILGAFVHSLRLNYVEFFPRFFTGGGEKFSPFQRETKYVTIK
jgi:V/A-type H+-transporting ATPase subunit I